MTESLFDTPQPGVLLAIGTFAAVPYIHLQLESRRRFYPDIPCLVHDDASPVAGVLRELCAQYDAEYVSPDHRLPPLCGDLSTILLAIQTAQARGLTFAVKMSRRFVPLSDWVPQLRHVASQTQYATYSNRDEGNGLGFRTECVAFHAPTWVAPEYVERVRWAIRQGGKAFGLVEPFLHDLARRVQAETQCAANREYERLYPRDPDTNAYGLWPWLGHNRKRRHLSWLWHQADDLLDYARIARAYNLPYSPEDFADPNMGYGQGYR